MTSESDFTQSFGSWSYSDGSVLEYSNLMNDQSVEYSWRKSSGDALIILEHDGGPYEVKRIPSQEIIDKNGFVRTKHIANVRSGETIFNGSRLIEALNEAKSYMVDTM